MEPLNVEHAGRTLRGVLHLPQPLREPVPAVVLCHGFSGNRIEFGYTFVRLARLLAARGAAVYRFDFAGCGESDGEFADLAISDQVAQVEAVLTELGRHQAIDPDRLSLLGMSMGGLTASLTAARRRVRSLTLWAPAAITLIFEEKEHDWRWPHIVERGYAELFGMPFYERFLEDGVNLDPFTDAVGHTGPVALLGGADDDILIPYVLDRYREIYGERLDMELIDGVGHDFGTVAAREHLLERTADFVMRHA